MATPSDHISRMIAAFRMGMTMKNERQSLALREESAVREAERMDLERQIAELTTKLKLNEVYSKVSRGGPASIPMASSQAGVTVPGAPVRDIPNEILLSALPKLGLSQPTSIPVNSADDLISLAIQEAQGVAKGRATGTREGEELTLSPLTREVMGDRASGAGLTGEAPTTSSPDEMRALTSLLGQYPELTKILRDIPGIATQGEEVATPELNARVRSVEERGASQRSAAARTAAEDRRKTMTPYQELQTIKSLSNDYKKFTGAARETLRYYTMIDSTVSALESGEIKDMNAATQAVINSFNRVVEPGSVTRETEYARSPEGQALLESLKGKVEALSKGGPGLTVKSLRQFADLTKRFTDQALKSVEGDTKRLKKLAGEYGLDEELITGGLTLSMPDSGAASPTLGGTVEEWVRDPKTKKLRRK